MGLPLTTIVLDLVSASFKGVQSLSYTVDQLNVIIINNLFAKILIQTIAYIIFLYHFYNRVDRADSFHIILQKTLSAPSLLCSSALKTTFHPPATFPLRTWKIEYGSNDVFFTEHILLNGFTLLHYLPHLHIRYCTVSVLLYFSTIYYTVLILLCFSRFTILSFSAHFFDNDHPFHTAHFSLYVLLLFYFTF